MVTIKQSFDYDEEYSFDDFCMNTLWSQARRNYLEMDWVEKKQLLNFLVELDEELTDTQLNDFIWFEWDDIKKELDNNKEEDEDEDN